MIDPWLSVDIAQNFTDSAPNAELIKLNNVGHYPQEHYHEAILEDLLPFVRRKDTHWQYLFGKNRYYKNETTDKHR